MLFLVELLLNFLLKKCTKGSRGEKLLSGLQLQKRKCVCQRLGVAAEENEQCPMSRQFLKEKTVSSCPAGSSCVESFPEALFCFCSLENSVLFSSEATIDLMLSVV